jgi:hypothetical protein
MLKHFVKTTHRLLMPATLVAALAATAAAQSVHREKIKIEPGPTIHVSKAQADLFHGENLAAGDLMHPGRLITCDMDFPPTNLDKYMDQNCYVSFDSGKTWENTLRITKGSGNGDPVESYGLGDDVYVVALELRTEHKVKDDDPDAPRNDANTVIYKSTDGGHTWQESSRFEFIDREFVNVDTTDGKYRGRVYLVGQGSAREISGGGGRSALKMWRSLDGGKTFLGPAVAAYPQGSIICGVGTGVVLSDGTLVGFFGMVKPGRGQSLEQEPSVGPNAELHVIMSKDGGETFTPSHKIADWRVDRPRSEGGMIGQLVADPGSKAFKDRLYVAYPEIVSDRIQIRSSYSTDKGKTWSRPVVVNDDRSPEKGDKGPDHLLPAIGVNKDGVVLITWADRRDARDNLGWRIRAAASLDGGETFSASVPVTEFSNAYTPTMPWTIGASSSTDDKAGMVSVGARLAIFFDSGGHTTGMAVDADGTFHPTWIDNHTGLAQLWTSSIKVSGTAVKNGASDLTDLKDISKSVSLELSKPSFDRAKGTLTVQAQLKNISKDKVEGPVKVRVLTLESELGVPEITNADNGQSGTGAIWDFSSTVSGPLESMKFGTPKTLTLRVTDIRPLAAGKDFKGGILNMDTKVFGKLQKEKSDKDKDADDDSKKDQQTDVDRDDI